MSLITITIHAKWWSLSPFLPLLLLLFIYLHAGYIIGMKPWNNTPRKEWIIKHVSKNINCYCLSCLCYTLRKKCYNDVDPPHTLIFWHFLDILVVESWNCVSRGFLSARTCLMERLCLYWIWFFSWECMHDLGFKTNHGRGNGVLTVHV